ncbi:TMM40 protein, partial [Rhynochetos jubatus]|nr:TMM40 protein [Rhynochetos jubatus]
MENPNVPFPALTEEQRGIFQRDFTADASYLENDENVNQSFWESLVKCLATTDPPILNAAEQSSLLSSCRLPPGGCAACLEAVEQKGVAAVAALYLLLKTTDPSGYRQLPSSKGKDEKLKLLKRLERNLMLSQGEKKAGNSSREPTDEDTQGKEDLFYLALIHNSSQGSKRRLSLAGCGKGNARLQQWTVRWMGIRKDDEFFHFVILCFAIGALLICYYYHRGKARLRREDELLHTRKTNKAQYLFCSLLDWTISLGIGLITFASLETTGIYFGLVYRLRSVLDSFVPLIDKFRPTGSSPLP